MRFRGRLRSPEDSGPGLPIAVILDDQGLTIESEGKPIGRWSLADVSASRTSSDQFAMTFGREHLIFEADDILAFSYEGLPHIDGTRTRAGMLTKIRSAFTVADAPPPVPSIDLRETRDIDVISIQPATEVAAEPTLPPPADLCRGTRRDGRPCRSSIALASGFCSSHDPNRPTRTRHVPVGDPSLAAVYRQLERAISDVRAGRMEPEAARALAELARAMCATIDADDAVQDSPDEEPRAVGGVS